MKAKSVRTGSGKAGVGPQFKPIMLKKVVVESPRASRPDLDTANLFNEDEAFENTTEGSGNPFEKEASIARKRGSSLTFNEVDQKHSPEPEAKAQSISHASLVDALQTAITHFESTTTTSKCKRRQGHKLLQREYNGLLAKYEELRESNSLLQRNYSGLRSQLAEVRLECERYKAEARQLKQQLENSKQREMRIVELYRREIVERQAAGSAFKQALGQVCSRKPCCKFQGCGSEDELHGKYCDSHAALADIERMEDYILRKEFELQVYTIVCHGSQTIKTQLQEKMSVEKRCETRVQSSYMSQVRKRQGQD